MKIWKRKVILNQIKVEKYMKDKSWMINYLLSYIHIHKKVFKLKSTIQIKIFLILPLIKMKTINNSSPKQKMQGSAFN